MKRILGIMGTKRLLITLIAFATLGIVGSGVSAAIASGANPLNSTSQINARGGEIVVNEKSAGIVELTSNRFTCASCARRVIPAIKALRGVKSIAFSPFVGISKGGSARNGLMGTLTVSFNRSELQPGIIAAAAQRALEADPYNRGTVRLVYR